LQAKAMRIDVVLSLFFVLVVAAVLIGGRSVIRPMLQAMAQPLDAHREGAIIFTMPGGTLCRHMAYDNQTAELMVNTLERCLEGRPRDAPRASNGFAWGSH
jgi:hypothetical protein